MKPAQSFTDYDIPERRCRICGYVVDAAADLDKGKEAPKDGDWDICLNCGALSVFTDDGKGVRSPTSEELLACAAPGCEHHRDD